MGFSSTRMQKRRDKVRIGSPVKLSQDDGPKMIKNGPQTLPTLIYCPFLPNEFAEARPPVRASEVREGKKKIGDLRFFS
jgi:hypothetical protein